VRSSNEVSLYSRGTGYERTWKGEFQLPGTLECSTGTTLQPTSQAYLTAAVISLMAISMSVTTACGCDT
jgi:hypothetical protein